MCLPCNFGSLENPDRKSGISGVKPQDKLLSPPAKRELPRCRKESNPTVSPCSASLRDPETDSLLFKGLLPDYALPSGFFPRNRHRKSCHSHEELHATSGSSSPDESNYAWWDRRLVFCILWWILSFVGRPMKRRDNVVPRQVGIVDVERHSFGLLGRQSLGGN